MVDLFVYNLTTCLHNTKTYTLDSKRDRNPTLNMWRPLKIGSNLLANCEGLSGIEVFEETAERQTKAKKSKKKKDTKKNNNSMKDRPKSKKSEPGQFVRVQQDSKKDDAVILNEMHAWKHLAVKLPLLRALNDKGYLSPTKIQDKCIHGSATSKTMDIVGAAETGSGKTYAFGIPIVQSILTDREMANESASEKNDELYAVIVTPTRELAVQVKDHLIHLCKYTNIRVALVVGGLAVEKQERLLNRNPEIVVGTPGRLWQLFTDGHPHLQKICNVRSLVIDEADRMLEQKHFEELGQLIDRMNMDPELHAKRRNFVFSATLTIVHDPPHYHKGTKIKPKNKLNDLLAQIGVKKHLVYDLTGEKVTPAALSEWKLECEFAEKDYYLVFFLKQNSGRCIIFCNSIGCVRRLANILTILQFKPLPLHANMEQKQRLRNLEKFRDSENGILIATDVAARGLDIPKVGHVVHYQVPRTAETYVHRSGRTARGVNTGASLLLISIDELKMYQKLMKTLKRDKDLEDFEVPADELDHVKKLVHVARDIDQTSLAAKRNNASQMWYSKVIEDMDICVDEDDLPTTASAQAMKKLKKDLKMKELELKQLLTTSFTPRGFSGKFPDVNSAVVSRKRKR